MLWRCATDHLQQNSWFKNPDIFDVSFWQRQALPPHGLCRLCVRSHCLPLPDPHAQQVSQPKLYAAPNFAKGLCLLLNEFFFLAHTRSSVTHSLLFLIAAIGAMSYYAMWTGLGVMYKTTDKSPRVIFWGRYLEQLLTQPVRGKKSRAQFCVRHRWL
jgi:hypothetical protein